MSFKDKTNAHYSKSKNLQVRVEEREILHRLFAQP